MDKMCENRLRWFGHVMRGNKCSKSCYENERWREKRKKKTKKRWLDAIENKIRGRWCVRKACKKSRRLKI
jgi:hypothetical protein